MTNRLLVGAAAAAEAVARTSATDSAIFELVNWFIPLCCYQRLSCIVYKNSMAKESRKISVNRQ
jgi:hypothetical protein